MVLKVEPSRIKRAFPNADPVRCIPHRAFKTVKDALKRRHILPETVCAIVPLPATKTGWKQVSVFGTNYWVRIRYRRGRRKVRMIWVQEQGPAFA